MVKIENKCSLWLVVCFLLPVITVYGQERVHDLYQKADYAVHHDRVFEDTWMGRTITTPRTWSVQKNSDGSFSYRNYTQKSGGNNGTYHEVLAKKYLSEEITVSKNTIAVYWEERQIRASEFYTAEDTSDPMKIGDMKVPADPFNDKKGYSEYKSKVNINGKDFKVTVKANCKHEHVPLYRGTDMGGGFGIGTTRNARGKTTATRDYFPDHLFIHKVKLTYSIDELAKLSGLSKPDLIVYMIEHNNENLGISTIQNSNGFIYCAYRAFALEQYKEQHMRQIRMKLAEQAKKDSIRKEELRRQDSILQVQKQEMQRQAELAYQHSLGSEKITSLKKAEKEGVKLVDLGLSVRWADRNIGSSSSYDAGLYFAWGEVIPRALDEERKYKPIIKPKKDAVLDTTSDPATVRWGVGWHVPTIQQWKELFEKCSMNETSDHTGVVFTGPNGNSIIIPFTNYAYWAHYWANESGYKGYGNNASVPRKAPSQVIAGETIKSSDKPKTGSIFAETPFPIRAVME
jgi:hypothetical protein